MIPVKPASTPQSLAATVRDIADTGFTATYVFAVKTPDPEKVFELIAGASDLVDAG